MLVTMLSGWSGRPLAIPLIGTVETRPPIEPAPAPPAEIVSDVVYSLRSGLMHSLVLTAVSAELAFRKSVYPDGHTEVEFEQGADRLTVATCGPTVAAARRDRAVSINVHSAGEEQLLRLRGLLIRSGALRAFRRLVVSIGDSQTDELESVSLRATDALLAQLDGDPGAIQRFCRELQSQYGGPVKRTRTTPPPPGCPPAYRKAILDSASRFQQALAGYACFNPARDSCAFEWIVELESTWFTHALGPPATAALRR